DPAQRDLHDAVRSGDLLSGQLHDRCPESVVFGQRGLAMRAPPLMGIAIDTAAIDDLGQHLLDPPTARQPLPARGAAHGRSALMTSSAGTPANSIARDAVVP